MILLVTDALGESALVSGKRVVVACFNCVKMKCQCEYLKNGMYFNDSGSEEVELSAGSA